MTDRDLDLERERAELEAEQARVLREASRAPACRCERPLPDGDGACVKCARMVRR